MQKFPKVFTLMSAIFALTFCAVSCKSDDDDEPTLYTVTVASSIEHGKVSVDKISAEAGTTIKLTATADEGYQLDSYSVKDASSNAITVTDGTFAMPKSNVTVSATFKETAETVNKNAANAVIAKINAIGTVAYTTESKAKIDDARKAYEELTGAQKALVPAETLALLTAAETAYTELKAAADSGTANQNAVDAVIAKINAIGTVAYTTESKAKIGEARTAYDALTEAQKALVPAETLAVLTKAETDYNALKTSADEAAANQAAANQTAANAVITKISAIGTVAYTDASKALIEAARTAYDALTAAQKELVTNYSTLTAAETTYSTLKTEADTATANQTAADAVITKINAIGTVAYTSDSKTKIDAARTAYDALTAAQKELVTNYSALTAAESRYSELKTAAEQQAITLSCATSTVEKGASITGTVAFSNFETTPTVVDVYIEGQEAAVKSNAPLTNGTFTINMSNLMVGTHMVYVKSGSVESNHISVTITKKAGSISYATTTVEKTTADGAFTNELTKTGDGTVSYSSSDANVATVNATTGEVTIAGAGTATITATVTDSDTYTYASKTASYTVSVTVTVQSETLLTTITGAGSNTNPATSANISYSTEGVATLTFSGSVNYSASWGWWGRSCSATVAPADGYTITKCVFYDNNDHSATDSSSPFVVETTEGDKTPLVNGNVINMSSSNGIKKIEVYGYVNP